MSAVPVRPLQDRLMRPQWVIDELKTVSLPDTRLNERMGLVLGRLAANPSAPFPQAFKGRAELEAAYRFFDNPRLDARKALAPHKDATLERVRQHPLVFLAQDTSEADLARPEEVVGGPLSDKKR